MTNAVTYLIARFFLSIWGFVWHWYVDGFWRVTKKAIAMLSSLDRTFALRLTLRNFFRPLYQDHTIPGHVFGFFFRTIRVALAILSYIIVVLGAIVVYVVWALLPFYILALGFKNNL
jgi:hypothetical protein